MSVWGVGKLLLAWCVGGAWSVVMKRFVIEIEGGEYKTDLKRNKIQTDFAWMEVAPNPLPHDSPVTKGALFVFICSHF